MASGASGEAVAAQDHAHQPALAERHHSVLRAQLGLLLDGERAGRLLPQGPRLGASEGCPDPKPGGSYPASGGAGGGGEPVLARALLAISQHLNLLNTLVWDKVDPGLGWRWGDPGRRSSRHRWLSRGCGMAEPTPAPCFGSPGPSHNRTNTRHRSRCHSRRSRSAPSPLLAALFLIRSPDPDRR